jgi:prevent-host-death family protein
MPDIRPVTDLRARAAEISRRVTEEHTPVILTKNGYANMVVMSYEQYVELNSRRELYRLLDEGKADIQNGNTIPFKTAMADIREDIKNGGI